MNALLKKLAGKAEQAEVYDLRSRTVPITFRSGRLESIKTLETRGQALRVIRDGRLGFASSTDVKDPSALIGAALAAAAYGDKAELSFPSDSPYRTPPSQRPRRDQGERGRPDRDRGEGDSKDRTGRSRRERERDPGEGYRYRVRGQHVRIVP